MRYAPEQRVHLITQLAVMFIQLGELEAALALEPEVLAGAGGSPARAWLAYAAGDWERAAAIAVEYARTARARGDNNYRWVALGWLGRAQIAQGDLAGARAALEEGIDICVQGGSAQGKAWVVPPLPRVYLDTGQVELALQQVEVVRSAYESPESAGAIGSRLAEVEAEIAVSQGDEDRGRRLFTESIAAYETYPEPFSEAEFRFRWSRQLRSLGDLAGADEQLGAARQIYVRIGAGRPWIDRLERAGA
jgi:tetratricopeptide (TPR) repeat protein